MGSLFFTLAHSINKNWSQDLSFGANKVPFLTKGKPTTKDCVLLICNQLPLSLNRFVKKRFKNYFRSGLKRQTKETI